MEVNDQGCIGNVHVYLLENRAFDRLATVIYDLKGRNRIVTLVISILLLLLLYVARAGWPDYALRKKLSEAPDAVAESDHKGRNDNPERNVEDHPECVQIPLCHGTVRTAAAREHEANEAHHRYDCQGHVRGPAVPHNERLVDSLWLAVDLGREKDRPKRLSQ